jgi:putative phosphoesterase
MTGDDRLSVARVGIVSDTHGAFDQRLMRALAGVDRILHAGDVGGPDILKALATIAPVVAVRGNVDLEGELSRLPAFAVVDVEGVRFVVTHRRDSGYRIDDARRAGCDVYVFGHTHIPHLEESQGLWMINPGSASRAREGNPDTVAIVEVSAGTVLDARLVTIG